MPTIEEIRNDFPILQQKIHENKPLVYLDNAATSQKPKQVYDSIYKYYAEYNANVHRGVHYLSEVASEAYEDARVKIQRFVNARYNHEIVFSRNASESFNLVASGWADKFLEKGDHVICTIMEHHSNIVPWQQATMRRGAILDVVDITEDYRLNLDQLREFIENHRPKIVAITHMSNVLGTINPIKDIARWVHDAGGLNLVDGAQSAPHMPINVLDLDIDFYAASGHKMCGPTGIGFLYGREELLEQMNPVIFGGDMIKEVHKDSAKWNDIPWKFEAGTPNIADTIGFGAAIDYLTNIGMNWIAQHEKDAISYALKRAYEENLIKVIGPTTNEDRGGVLSFTFDPFHPHDVAQILDQEGIAIRSGHHCAQPLMERLGVQATSRASFYLYTTMEEIDYFFDGLKQVQTIFT